MATSKANSDNAEPTLMPTGREETFAMWAEHGITPKTLECNDKGTIQAARYACDTNDHFTIGRLPQLSTSEDSQEAASAPMVGLHIGEVIGEGGMGQIQAATQVPLHREVAIKRVRKDRRNPRALMALLREGWVMGALEHPNILPVYTMGVDAAGDPIFVMKRIDGSPWNEVMHNASHPIRKQGTQDHLGWNLGILRQVCNGLRFAHNKGILHRDLKPENVMIGRFGEVYLLDWGIAVSVSEDPSSPIPGATKDLVGTPAYMAPEMATLSPDLLGPWTDVYQLGAILHNILVDAPKHLGASLMEILYQAVQSTPYPYPSKVPEGLATLCNKATHVSPEERPADADAFAKAIDLFIEHRASIQLTEETQQVAARLDVLLTTARKTEQSASGQTLQSNAIHPGTMVAGDSPEERHVRIYELFSQCQFGFQQALRSWPDNQEATDSLQEVFASMTWYEIHQGDHKSACLHFAKLSQPDEALTEELKELATAQQDASERIAMLEQYQRDTNSLAGIRGRIAICILAAALEFPFFLSYSKTFGWVEFKNVYFLIFGACFSAGAISFTLWFRQTPDRNITGLRIANSLIVMSLFIWGILLFGWIKELPPSDVVAMVFLAFSFFFGLSATLLESFLWMPVLSCIIGFVLIVIFPTWTFDIATIFGPLALLLVPFSWYLYKDHIDPLHFNQPTNK